MTATVPTPRTDSLAQISDNWLAFMQLARQLERENAALRAMLDAEPSEAMIKAGEKIGLFRSSVIRLYKAMRAAQRIADINNCSKHGDYVGSDCQVCLIESEHRAATKQEAK